MNPVSNPLFKLDGRVALVTGSGQGMGLGVVRALCRQGASVVINDYYPERAEGAAAALKAEGITALSSSPVALEKGPEVTETDIGAALQALQIAKEAKPA